MKVGADTLTGNGQKKNFTWTGNTENILLSVKDNPEASFSGQWALFHFINDGRPAYKGQGIYDLEFVKQLNGKDFLINGKKQSYTYELQFSNGNPWGEFSGIRCVAQVTR